MMTSCLNIRPGNSDDLDRLLDLYIHLSPTNTRYSLEQAQEIFTRFQCYPGSQILVGEIGNVLVASCTVVVVPNLTRGGKPYALVENVVTHTDHRGKGYGKATLHAAIDHSWEQDCYKIMLMTGSSENRTLSFYESAGFSQTKTGFQIRRPQTAT